MKFFQPVISDHALLRWLERVHGIDVEFFRSQMLLEIGDALASGATAFKSGGYWYAANGRGVMTTVLFEKPKGGRTQERVEDARTERLRS